MTDLAYDDAGLGTPVVLLHGGPLGPAQWDAEFAAIRRTVLQRSSNSSA